MAKRVKFDTSFDFGANAKPKKAKKSGGKSKRKPSGVRVWKGQTYGS